MEFEEVYKLYYKDVYYFLLSLSSNAQTAEELTQETFYLALKNINKFKGECKLKSWLCQIGKNAYISWVRKQKYLTDDALSMDSVSDNENEPEATCIRKSEALSIYKVLHILEEPYKEVFTLRTLGDLSFREIGEIFGKGEGWARVVYHRAKLRIQEQIQEVS